MKGSIGKILNTAMGSSLGRIREFIKECGMMENSMEKEFLLIRKEWKKPENGLREKEYYLKKRNDRFEN